MGKPKARVIAGATSSANNVAASSTSALQVTGKTGANDTVDDPGSPRVPGSPRDPGSPRAKWGKARVVSTIAKISPRSPRKTEAGLDQMYKSESAADEAEITARSQAEVQQTVRANYKRRKVYSMTRKALGNEEQVSSKSPYESEEAESIAEPDSPTSNSPKSARRRSFAEVIGRVATSVKAVSSEAMMLAGFWEGSCSKQVERMLRKHVRKAVSEEDFMSVLKRELNLNFSLVKNHITILEDQHEVQLTKITERIAEFQSHVESLGGISVELGVKTAELKELLDSHNFSSADLSEAKAVRLRINEQCLETVKEIKRELVYFGNPGKGTVLSPEDVEIINPVVELLSSLSLEEKRPFADCLLRLTAVGELGNENPELDLEEAWQACEVQFLKLESEDYDSLPFSKLTALKEQFIEALQRRAWKERVSDAIDTSMDAKFRALDTLVKDVEIGLAPARPKRHLLRGSSEESTALPQVLARIHCAVPPPSAPPPPPPPRRASSSIFRSPAAVLDVSRLALKRRASAGDVTLGDVPVPAKPPIVHNQSLMMTQLDTTIENNAAQLAPPAPEPPQLPEAPQPPDEDVQSEASSFFSAFGVDNNMKETNLHVRWQILQQQRQRVCGRTMLWLRQTKLVSSQRLLPDIRTQLQGASNKHGIPCPSSMVLVANTLISPRNAAITMRPSWDSPMPSPQQQVDAFSLRYQNPSPFHIPLKTSRPWDRVS